MILVVLIITLAVIEYIVFSALVGRARAQYGIEAPAITGNPQFERYFRVQQNTLEQLASFIPALLVFSWSAENVGWPGYNIAAGLGLIWIVGRMLYANSYIKDPNSRVVGMMMTMLPTMFMLLGALVSILVGLI